MYAIQLATYIHQSLRTFPRATCVSAAVVIDQNRAGYTDSHKLWALFPRWGHTDKISCSVEIARNRLNI